MAKKRAKVAEIFESTIPARPAESWSKRIAYCIKQLYYSDILTDAQYLKAMRRAETINSITISIRPPTTKRKAKR